jgi:hypothetical protein
LADWDYQPPLHTYTFHQQNKDPTLTPPSRVASHVTTVFVGLWFLVRCESRFAAFPGEAFIMPNIDIDPAALSRPVVSTTPILPPKSINTLAATVTKPSKALHVPPRIDLEPLYTALKAAIGESWGTYKESISLFVMGKFIELI